MPKCNQFFAAGSLRRTHRITRQIIEARIDQTITNNDTADRTQQRFRRKLTLGGGTFKLDTVAHAKTDTKRLTACTRAFAAQGAIGIQGGVAPASAFSSVRLKINTEFLQIRNPERFEISDPAHITDRHLHLGFSGSTTRPWRSRPFSSSITASGTRAGRSPSVIRPMTPGAKRAACHCKTMTTKA
jgi:hypothetical protein